jgi:fructose-bisphosphate aldolase, class II
LRMTQFGQAGHARDYAPKNIEEMAKGYASGALDTRPSMAGAR